MTANELSKKLAAQGAILTLPRVGTDVLIGHWEWLDDSQVFYFEAGNESEFGGHVLSFARAIVPHWLGVEFRDAAGELVAYLTTIDAAAADGGAQYRETWKDWQQIIGETAAFVQEIKHQLTA